jgi:hypothetical protein
LLYALHGAVVLLVTRGWPRFRPLVPWLAGLHVAFGGGMVAVDLEAGMPWWWAVADGSAIAFGIIVLIVYRRASWAEPGVQRAGG